MENEIKTNEGQQAQTLGLLNAKDVVVSVVKVTAEGVSIKLWPDADAVRGVLSEAAQLAQVPGATCVGGRCTAPCSWATPPGTRPARRATMCTATPTSTRPMAA